VTIREWVEQRTPRPPAALVRRMVEMLGEAANDDATRAAELCLNAAEGALRELVAAQRFGRDNALDLLAIDALTTYAYEHASATATSEPELLRFTERGAQVLGRLAVQHG
jgi:uncharacterized membrane protein